MMQKMFVFGIIRSLHDLFTVLWIGGMLTTAFTFMPVLKKSSSKQNNFNDLKQGIQNRLRLFAVISIAGLWITGLLLSKQSPAYSGGLNFSTLNDSLMAVKHLIILLMVVIAVFRGFILGRNILSFSPGQKKAYTGLLLVNSILGIVVLFLSGLSTAFS